MYGRERHVVGHYRLGQPFDGKRSDFFQCYGLLDRDGYSLGDKDLFILGLSAKARGEIAHGTFAVSSGISLVGPRHPRDDGQIGTSVGSAGALHDVECRDRPPKTL